MCKTLGQSQNLCRARLCRQFQPDVKKWSLFRGKSTSSKPTSQKRPRNRVDIKKQNIPNRFNMQPFSFGRCLQVFHSCTLNCVLYLGVHVVQYWDLTSISRSAWRVGPHGGIVCFSCKRVLLQCGGNCRSKPGRGTSPGGEGQGGPSLTGCLEHDCVSWMPAELWNFIRWGESEDKVLFKKIF